MTARFFSYYHSQLDWESNLQAICNLYSIDFCEDENPMLNRIKTNMTYKQNKRIFARNLDQWHHLNNWEFQKII